MADLKPRSAGPSLPAPRPAAATSRQVGSGRPAGKSKVCQRHGLGMGPDGRCVVCRREGDGDTVAPASEVVVFAGPDRRFQRRLAFGVGGAVLLVLLVFAMSAGLDPTTGAPDAQVLAPLSGTDPLSNSLVASAAELQRAAPLDNATRVRSARSATLPTTIAAGAAEPAEAARQGDQAATPAAEPATIRAWAAAVPVVLYCSSAARDCEGARAGLRANGLSFDELDVTQAGRLDELRRASGGTSTPTVVVDGHSVPGASVTAVLSEVASSIERVHGVSGITLGPKR